VRYFKGKYLERYCQNPLENSIKWWAKPGRNSTEGLEWLKENLKYKIGHLDNIALRDISLRFLQFLDSYLLLSELFHLFDL
jgi:hypothetical protein